MDDPTQPFPPHLAAELEGLLGEGFPGWSRGEWEALFTLLRRTGRDTPLASLHRDLCMQGVGKSKEEVGAYLVALWARGEVAWGKDRWSTNIARKVD